MKKQLAFVAVTVLGIYLCLLLAVGLSREGEKITIGIRCGHWIFPRYENGIAQEKPIVIEGDTDIIVLPNKIVVLGQDYNGNTIVEGETSLNVLAKIQGELPGMTKDPVCVYVLK
jgi:hypothetical protein